jgi:hypothetical protein
MAYFVQIAPINIFNHPTPEALDICAPGEEIPAEDRVLDWGPNLIE